MLYFDTSFVAPLFKAEGRSADVKRFVAGLAVGRMAVSQWTQVEFSSLLAKSVRIGPMTPSQADDAGMAFETFVARGCAILGVADRDFDEARRLLADHRSGLRAGDALHLAVASNNAAQGIYSLDKTMVAVGRSLGLPMNAGLPAAF